MVLYEEDVVIKNYRLQLKYTDYWWVDLRCIQNPNGQGWPGILEVNNHIKCLKDISAMGGALMTASWPGSTGGGAINMGHAWERTDDPPRINLTDDGYHTLYITAGSSVGGGADAVLADMKLKNLTATGQLALPAQGSSGGLTIGGDTNLYRGNAYALKTDDALIIGGQDYSRALILLNGSIAFGTALDTRLYRSATSLLRTNATFQAEGYKSSDGTNGATADVAISGTTLHFKNGLFVGTN